MNAEQKAFSNAYLYSMAGVTMPDFVEFFQQFPISPEKREVDMPAYKWDAIEDAWVVWTAAVKFTKEQST
jgi:hypothetical protein